MIFINSNLFQTRKNKKQQKIYLYVFRLDLHTHKLEDLKNKINFFFKGLRIRKKKRVHATQREKEVYRTIISFFSVERNLIIKHFFFFFLFFLFCCCHFGVFFFFFFIDFTLDRRFFAKRFFVFLFQILFYLFLGKIK